MADEYWGRYKTIMVAIGVAVVGHIVLIISAIPPVIVHPNSSVACFAVGLVIMGIGVGGFKSNISPLIAEQYKDLSLTVKTLPTGERVIVDPTFTISRIYMYFYMMINVGSLLGSVIMVCEYSPPSSSVSRTCADTVSVQTLRRTLASGFRLPCRQSCSCSVRWSCGSAATSTSAARLPAMSLPRP